MSKPTVHSDRTSRKGGARSRSRFLWYALAFVLLALAVCACVRGCRNEIVAGGGEISPPASFPPLKEDEKGDVLVTGYCNCGECCGWEFSWLGFGPPVYTYGAQKGKKKKVGVTARGTEAHLGTVAADPKVFPFGTRLLIPGYGTGVVEDVGGAIKGKHIDVWFSSHQTALNWGRRDLKVVKLP